MTENSSNNRENETEREDYACLYCGVDVCYHLLSSEGVKRRQQGKSLKKMCVYTTDLEIYWLSVNVLENKLENHIHLFIKCIYFWALFFFNKFYNYIIKYI